MLFNTSLVALVSLVGTTLVIYNTKRKTNICELDYESPIISVKLNKKRLIVALEENIFVYDMSNMKMLHQINTAMNPMTVCALSPSSDNCYLAYLPNATAQAGQVLLFNADNLQAVQLIPAHRNPISNIAFSFDGRMIATASDKGTVIRVFSVPSGAKLYQFRRGSYAARIFSLSFSVSGDFLCVCSETDTIHIFKLASPNSTTTPATAQAKRISQGDNAKRSLSGGLSSMYDTLLSPVASTASYLLPTNITEMWEPQRHFAHAKTPIGMIKRNSSSNTASLSLGASNICAITANNLLVVATTDGNFYQYFFDVENGGECVLRINVALEDTNFL